MGRQLAKRLIESDEVLLDKAYLGPHARLVERVINDAGDTGLRDHVRPWEGQQNLS